VSGAMFGKVLIAARGEIALRVARTCRELGIRTVAVYSTADRQTAVVDFADEAVHIGPPTARRSYLNAAAIIEAAHATGAEAIHPGYGFLAEDPDFAEICAANDVRFIGPPAHVLAALGEKSQARDIMAAAGLPVLGSGAGGSQAGPPDQLREEAAAVGYPLIIKPSAGGGGKGMTVVRGAADLLTAYAHARSTAQAIFGDARVYLEPYLDRARHVEVQVLADQHGHVIHLGTRDCSVQRRNQKLIEEAPAPAVHADVLEAMTEASVRASRAVGYQGAGTFEFLLDDQGSFFFIEINCRIQVEHPVTEMVTGVEIVREQLRAAAGLPLSVAQQDVSVRGVSIECRINAEDPRRGFAPAPGRLTEFHCPGGPFTRVDTHGRPGLTITPDYDSLLAKVVVWAPDRAQAVSRMDRALSEFRATGPGLATTTDFLRSVLASQPFRNAEHTTALVDQLRAERSAA
jgi:acetyl-CoA carboxylase biotin carboxylase subunit